eukprot:809150-Rhodomonas_salina.1
MICFNNGTSRGHLALKLLGTQCRIPTGKTLVHGGTRVPVCPHNRAPVVYLRAKVVPVEKLPGRAGRGGRVSCGAGSEEAQSEGLYTAEKGALGQVALKRCG